jgi:hypothetical protein
MKEDELTRALLNGGNVFPKDVLIKVGCDLMSTTRCWRHDDGYLIVEVDENEYSIRKSPAN